MARGIHQVGSIEHLKRLFRGSQPYSDDVTRVLIPAASVEVAPRKSMALKAPLPFITNPWVTLAASAKLPQSVRRR